MMAEMEKETATSWSGVSRNGILIALGVVVTVAVVGSVVSKENSTAIIGFCSLICVSLFSELRRIQTDAEQSLAARKTAANVADVKTALGVSDEKVEEVKNNLVVSEQKTTAQLTSIAKVAADTHTLVNSNFGVQLRLNMELSRWKADQTKLTADIDAANSAQKLYEEHMAKQATVDAKPAEPAAPPQPVPVTIVPSAQPLPVQIKPRT